MGIWHLRLAPHLEDNLQCASQFLSLDITPRNPTHLAEAYHPIKNSNLIPYTPKYKPNISEPSYVHGSRCDHSGIALICDHMNFSSLLAHLAYAVVSLLYFLQLSNTNFASRMKSSGVG